MNVIQCPNEYKKMNNDLVVFLGGGISGCLDWQNQFECMMVGTEGLTLINPRRMVFDIKNITLTEEQIEWEYRHFQHCHIHLYWFPKETVCPITLFELGKSLMSPVVTVVGCDPEYVRRHDVRKQVALTQDFTPVAGSLEELMEHLILQKDKYECLMSQTSWKPMAMGDTTKKKSTFDTYERIRQLNSLIGT